MLTDQEKKLLQEEYLDAELDDAAIAELTMEEAVWMATKAAPEVKEKVEERAKQMIRDAVDLSLVISPTTRYPHMTENGRVDLFSDLMLAQEHAEKLREAGWKVEATRYGQTEDLLLFLYRVGVQEVCIHVEREQVLILPICELHTEEHADLNGNRDIYTLNPDLHAACNRYIAQSERTEGSEEALRAETEFLNRLSDARLLFAVARGAGVFEPQFAEVPLNDTKTTMAALCVFFDETELLKCFDAEAFVTFFGGLDDILEKGRDIGAVIDPYGASLFLDRDALTTYENFNSAKNRTLVFMADAYNMPPEETNKRLNSLVFHEDIWAEFVRASENSTAYIFHYPIRNAASVNGYTAERISHMLSSNPLDAYVALVRLKENYEQTIEALKTGTFEI